MFVDFAWTSLPLTQLAADTEYVEAVNKDNMINPEMAD